METLLASPLFMSSSQLQTELLRCEFCEEKPCREACPAHCSPADFIRAARVGYASDIRRSAGEIMHANPLGGICGMVCPDTLCMAACTRMKFDGSINIPLVQATIVERAKNLGGIPEFSYPAQNGKRVAVIGGGPAGLGASSVLAQLGYKVVLYEASNRLGGMANLIPEYRLSRNVLTTDIQFVLSLGNIVVKTGATCNEPGMLLEDGYAAVCIATGLWKPIELGIENERSVIKMVDLLQDPSKYQFNGRVAIVGGGATAVDCAIVAKHRGASHLELFMLESLAEMPLTGRERKELLDNDIEVNCRTRIKRIGFDSNGQKILETLRVKLPAGKSFSPANVEDESNSDFTRTGFSEVILAIGMRSALQRVQTAGLFYAGDMATGPSSVVEAVASGKNSAISIDAYLKNQLLININKPTKSYYLLPGYSPLPVSLATDFFGRRIHSPYLVSASPSTDGIDQMTSAFKSGWAGAVMKTAFDNVPIHIPGEYMFVFNPLTYGNSDNVSGHSLDRVCREVEQLVKQWPDRLILASTGGPVTGNDEADAKVWKSNTKKLESAGAMGIEYSLSCPQGGDGTEGAIVSQNAALTSKIVDWVLASSDPDVPKLFKLSAAVTSIVPILRAIRKILEKYPLKKAGITLANSFPTLAFSPAVNQRWEEGVVVGMSGEGVTPISYLTLAQAIPEGIVISGNGGPMNYKAAMDFLALGVKTVQFCTIVMKYGYGIINDLESGTSFLMQERGIHSMDELIGIVQPHPITDFMELTSIKKISTADPDLCVSCGNCSRCPYLAIQLDDKLMPYTDPKRCIGCSICAKKCFTGAISMRTRSAEELQLLTEH
jgi:NADPH-dependent glutamate synthase beta subunit-like oxidoreductase/dihydroorotate dehydrogenase/Pyruvate/2-oxoacid:ferredoxin oxidoreductase delta subunit